MLASLFSVEMWERFSFYGMQGILLYYMYFSAAQGGLEIEQGLAAGLIGAYGGGVYLSTILGAWLADRVLGSERVLFGAALLIMAGHIALALVPGIPGLIAGLVLVGVGSGGLKANATALVGSLYGAKDERRDAGFSIFYMGINAGALVAPLVTGWLASVITDTPMEQNYKVVFAATGVGMIISFLWFWFGRRQLKGIGDPPGERHGMKNLLAVIVGAAVAVPIVYLLIDKVGAEILAWVLLSLFIGLAVMLLVEALREGKVQTHRVIAMLIIFGFNVLFWMFFEQAGSSFNFLAEGIVDRKMFGGWEFPVGWFQSVNPIAIVLLAPIAALTWGYLGRKKMEPSIPRKFGLGLLGNAIAFLVLMYALTNLVGPDGLIPFWPLVLVYVLQTAGELCLSPIGLSMVTKLAPIRFVGLAMGGWFLSTAIGNNLSGIFAGSVSGETGMTVASALSGFTFSFWLLLGAGVLLFLIAPLINKLMHGVK